MVHFQDLHGSMLQYYRVFCLFFCSYVLFQFSLSLPHFCDFIHIFTSSLAFFHLTFHLASYGLQYFDFFFFPYQHIQNYKLLIVFPSDCHTARSLVSSHTPFLHLAVRHLNSVPSLPRPFRSQNFLPYFFTTEISVTSLPASQSQENQGTFLAFWQHWNNLLFSASWALNKMKSRGRADHLA